MTREPVRSSEAPAPSGSYSQAIRVGDLLFLSGQVPFGPDGKLVGGSVGDQVRQSLRNLDAVARAAGGSLERAVRVGAYLSDLRHFAEFDAAYREFFPEPRPARTTIQSDLVGFDVEIDAIVWLGD